MFTKLKVKVDTVIEKNEDHVISQGFSALA